MLAIVRILNTHGKARGLSAWYRTMREAEGQVEAMKHEVTENVLYSGRKAVAAKDVVITIEKWEGEHREYTSLTGFVVDDTLKVLSLKRMVPETIKHTYTPRAYFQYLCGLLLQQANILGWVKKLGCSKVDQNEANIPKYTPTNTNCIQHLHNTYTQNGLRKQVKTKQAPLGGPRSGTQRVCWQVRLLLNSHFACIICISV